LGGTRGRLISTSDRREAITLIDEAVDAGARLQLACKELGIDERTYYRWKKQEKETQSISDKRKDCIRPEPSNKLTDAEREKILEIVNRPEYASKPPCEIVPDLADKGEYIASESTFYRVLRNNKLQNHRGRSEQPKHNHPTTYSADGPNHVWMWDITYLNGPVKGLFYYLYLFLDLYDRSVVGWEVYEEESADLAAQLVKKICLKQGKLSTQPLVLHSDNGSPMKGATMLATLYQLGIKPSNSRPRVSNDNPYSESMFKTLKYCPYFQPKGFKTVEEARNWVQVFVNDYNFVHHHSGIKFLTPIQMRSGKGKEVLAARHEIYEAAKAAHPERWNGRNTRDWSMPPRVYLNPERKVEVTIISEKDVQKAS